MGTQHFTHLCADCSLPLCRSPRECGANDESATYVKGISEFHHDYVMFANVLLVHKSGRRVAFDAVDIQLFGEEDQASRCSPL